MSVEAVNTLVGQLLKPTPPDAASLEAALGAALKPAGQNNHWVNYEFELAGGPFEGGEARLGRDGARALVSFRPREAAGLMEATLDLKPYEPLVTIDVNPQIPPEGTDAYVYRPEGVKVAFQFRHNSRSLRTLVMEWGAAPV
jgi:hypothetical protein